MKTNSMIRSLSFALLITVLMLCFSSCNRNTFQCASDDTPQKEQQIKIHAYSNSLYDIAAGDETYKNLKVLYSCESSSDKSGRIKSAAIYGSVLERPYTPLLIVMSNDIPLLFKLEKCDAPYPIVRMQDIDGDGQDEIIVDSIQGASHFVRSVLFILKVVEDKLELLYRFPEHSYAGEEALPIEMNNFGFTSQLMDNYQLLIEYPLTKFSKVFDLSYLYNKGLLYDDSGNLLPNVETFDIVYFDSVLVSDIQDVVGDGLYEIIGVQAAHIDAQDHFGSAAITLKYNTHSKTVEVVTVDFELAV